MLDLQDDVPALGHACAEGLLALAAGPAARVRAVAQPSSGPSQRLMMLTIAGSRLPVAEPLVHAALAEPQVPVDPVPRLRNPPCGEIEVQARYLQRLGTRRAVRLGRPSIAGVQGCRRKCLVSPIQFLAQERLEAPLANVAGGTSGFSRARVHLPAARSGMSMKPGRLAQASR